MANEFKVRKGLIVQGSGSTILDILGSQGELFSVTDSLVGSLFSVNDISGIPIMEVFSDNTIKMGTFNQEAIIVSGSRTGMGTALPQAELHISGANNDSLFRIQSPAAASIIFVSGSGNVGIGTLTPTNTLNVSGTTFLQGGQTTIRGSGTTSATTALRVENSSVAARLTILDDGTSAFNTSHLYISSSGNVGIGLTAMTAKLHVSGASNAGLFEIDSPAVNNIIYVSGSGNVGIGTNLPSADLHISGASADSLLRVGSPTDSNILFITGSGRVGIGTNLPSAELHVSGASIDSLLRVGSPTNASILFVTGSGNVGINTTSPMAFFSGSGGAFGSGEGNIVPTLTIFQSSSATGLNAAGLQIVGSGSSALAAARLNILTMGDKYAYLNIGTSGSGTENNYWEFAKRPSSAVHSLLLSNYSNGVYQSNIMSLSPGANTSIIGSSNQILLEGSTGYIGLQTNTPGTSDWIHLHSKPNDGNYINIDATQTSNPPPLTAATAKTGYGITTNAYYLAEPDFWMEIKLDGAIVLVPCYLPAP